MSKTLYRNPAYLTFIRWHASCLSWEDGLPIRLDEPTCHAHHVRLGNGGGVGIKPSDYRCVPLTDQEHRELHQKGERRFWREAAVDPDQIIIALLAAYLGEDALLVEPKACIAELERLAEARR